MHYINTENTLVELLLLPVKCPLYAEVASAEMSIIPLATVALTTAPSLNAIVNFFRVLLFTSVNSVFDITTLFQITALDKSGFCIVPFCNISTRM